MKFGHFFGLCVLIVSMTALVEVIMSMSAVRPHQKHLVKPSEAHTLTGWVGFLSPIYKCSRGEFLFNCVLCAS